jgi:hypothetical protein
MQRKLRDGTSSDRQALATIFSIRSRRSIRRLKINLTDLQDWKLHRPIEMSTAICSIGFPTYVAYEILPEEVVVLAVAHGRRRPGYWKKRLR